MSTRRKITAQPKPDGTHALVLLRPRTGKNVGKLTPYVKTPVLYALRHVSVSPTVTAALPRCREHMSDDLMVSRQERVL